MTITTVGYELNPKTLLGKLIGGFCALSGIFILTLPIPIVVNRWPDVQTLAYIVSYSRLFHMIIASASQFHIFLPWINAYLS